MQHTDETYLRKRQDDPPKRRGDKERRSARGRGQPKQTVCQAGTAFLNSTISIREEETRRRRGERGVKAEERLREENEGLKLMVEGKAPLPFPT